MNKYIDAELFIRKIKNQIRLESLNFAALGGGEQSLCIKILTWVLKQIDSLQQEQPETEMKSPFTGGKVTILSREEEVTFRGEKVKITRKYYRCEDTGREFTDSKLDEDMMWDTFRAYCEKKGMTSFTDIMLRQEQPEVDLDFQVFAKEMDAVFNLQKEVTENTEENPLN